MKDHTVLPVEARDISMVKSSPDLYVIYLKNGQFLELKKENVEKIRMTDMDLIRKFDRTINIFTAVLAVLTAGGIWLLLTQL